MSDEQSEIQGIEISFAGSTNISVHADFLLGDSATPSSEEDGISGTYEKNINGDGKLSLNWRSSQGGGLSAGQEVTVTKGGEVVGKYFLQENYVPSPNGDGTYTWSPTFIDSDSKMKGVIVYKEVQIYRRAVGSSSISTKSVDIYTFPYTGSAKALVTYLNTLASEAQVGSIVLGEAYQGDDVTVTVSFDQDNLVSACEKIASALGTQSTIEDGSICIGTHDAVLAVSEHYDRFIILGGTRNMGKYSLSDDDTYAAVTMRLTLPESLSPKSVVTLEGGSLVDCPSPYNTQLGQPYMTKVIIFDDIYPQILLEIGDVRERICYLYDEEGHLMYVNETIDGQEVRKPKTYSKFYITLKLDGEQYNFNVKSVIEGRTLGIVFQDGLLCGREFDLSYYDLAESGRAYIDETNSDEDQIYYDEDDTEHLYPHQEWKAYDGEFRICMVADGDTLLPNHTLKPETGNHVTLTGVALDGQYEAKAKQRLAEEALPYVQLYMSTKAQDGEYESQVASNESEYVVDFLTGETIDVSPGDSINKDGSIPQEGVEGDYIVTSVTTDIKTGKQSVRYGTFEPQSRSMSNANNLETASVSEGGALIGQYKEEDYIRHTAAMGLDQFGALYEIYGHLGMKRVDTRFEGFTEEFTGMLDDVKEQTDQAFLIWFAEYNPTNGNFPSSEWTTNELKALHLQDVFYNTDRQPGLTGGRMWRWVRDGGTEYTITQYIEGEDDEPDTVICGGNTFDATEGEVVYENDVPTTFIIYTYSWEEITDGDTLASLEKLADVSNDAILSGGSEKSRVRTEWLHCVAEYIRYKEQAEDYGMMGDDSDDDSSSSGESLFSQSWLDYDGAFWRLTTYLNGGEASQAIKTFIDGGGTSTPIPYPAWISEANLSTNTSMPSVSEVPGATYYRNAWKAYYDALESLVTDINITAKAIADAAQDAAEEALSRISAMASDSVLDPSEKADVKREFTAIFHEILDSTGILDKASTVNEDAGYEIDYIVDYTTYIKPLIDSFNALGSLLNGDTSATAEADKWKLPTISITSQGRWGKYELVDEIPSTQVAGTSYKLYPTWLKGLDKNLPNDIDPDVWHKLWSDLYTARSNAYTAMSDNALNHAESALQKLANMADDDILTAEEKGAVRREWERVVSEDEVLVAKAVAAGIQSSTVLSSYFGASYDLYYFLDDMSAAPSVTAGTNTLAYLVSTYGEPSDLYAEGDVGGTDFENEDFKEIWAAYYAAAESLRAAINNTNTKFFVTEDVSGDPTLPTPPYEEGNVWLRKTADGNYLTYYCKQAKTANQSASINDWYLFSAKDENTMRGTLAELADLVYRLTNPSGNGKMATVNLSTGSISSNMSADLSSVDMNMIALLQSYLGNITFGIYYGGISGTASKYDLVCTPINCTIPGSSDTLVGGISIKMWNGTGYEYIQQSTSAMINNLGTAINAVVFGSNAAAVEAAGMSIGQRFAQMFAQATVYDPQNPSADSGGYVKLTQALFGLSVDKVNGKYVSSAQLSADKIDFAGKTINLTASIININANQITWNGKDVIPGTAPSGTTYVASEHSNFFVDGSDNVHMNNAYIKGTVVANAGKIGGASGWTIESQKLHGGGTLGQDDSMWLATTNLAGDIGGNEIQSSQIGTKGWRFTVGSKFGVLNDGTLVSQNGIIQGQLYADSSDGSITIGNGVIRIQGTNGKLEIGFVSGNPVLQYYDSDGNFLYDLGPNGLTTSTVREAKLIDYYFRKLDNVTSEQEVVQSIATLFSVSARSESTDHKYYFLCRINAGRKTSDDEYVTDPSLVDDLDEKYFDRINSAAPKITTGNWMTGWYYAPTQSIFPTPSGQPGTSIKVYNGYGTPDKDYQRNSSYYPSGCLGSGWPQSSWDASQDLLLYVEAYQFNQGKLIQVLKVFMRKSYYDSHKNSSGVVVI